MPSFIQFLRIFRCISSARDLTLLGLLVALVVALGGRGIGGYVFNIYVVETRQSFTASEELCRSLGYDGLAVLSTPEMFNVAFRHTEVMR